MIILYKNAAAEKQFSSEYREIWKYPEQVKIKLLSTENYIKNAISLQDIVNYRPFHFHQLTGNRKGEWSIYLGNTGYRVTLLPCDEKNNTITSGDIIAQCRFIRIIMITGVSNHYE